MTSYEFECALVYLAEQVIKTFGKDVGVQELKQEPVGRDFEKTRSTGEPRIEDEKVRRVVKTWAELNAIKQVVYVEYESSDGSYCCLANIDDGRISIKFAGCISALKDCREYAIDELCEKGENDGVY